MTREQLDDRLRAFEDLCDELSQAARRYAKLTGARHIGELDASSLYPGTDTIVFRWEDWAYSCLRDSGEFHLPAEFLIDEERVTARMLAEQQAERQAAERAERDRQRQAEQRERDQLRRLIAKHGIPEDLDA